MAGIAVEKYDVSNPQLYLKVNLFLEEPYISLGPFSLRIEKASSTWAYIEVHIHVYRLKILSSLCVWAIIP